MKYLDEYSEEIEDLLESYMEARDSIDEAIPRRTGKQSVLAQKNWSVWSPAHDFMFLLAALDPDESTPYGYTWGSRQ